MNFTENRPIVTKFVKFKERELWKSNDRKYEVNEHFSKGINDKRKKLYPQFKSAKSQGKRAGLVYDKSYIDLDGKRFVPSGLRNDTNGSSVRNDTNGSSVPICPRSGARHHNSTPPVAALGQPWGL